jgi:mRNA interferase MazF
VRRGDLVTVADSGDYGKPRPALIIQSDLLPDTDSVLVCLLTTTERDAPLYRVSVPAGGTTWLRDASQIMVDKIMAVRRDKCSAPIGRIDDATLLALGRLLALAIGLVG